jgi:hypothetical protein
MAHGTFWLPSSLILPGDYELGRILACHGKVEEARQHFHAILSGLAP